MVMTSVRQKVLQNQKKFTKPLQNKKKVYKIIFLFTKSNVEFTKPQHLYSFCKLEKYFVKSSDEFCKHHKNFVKFNPRFCKEFFVL